MNEIAADCSRATLDSLPKRRGGSAGLIRSALVAVAIALAGALALASGAGACSCARLDPREALERVDAAVIGTALRSEEVNGRRLTHLRVERSFKAELGAEAVVDTGRAEGGGADCSLELADGDRVGLYLSRTDAGGWSAGLCSLVDPDELERGAAPIPAPLGRGRVALVAALGLDGHRLAALDARGRVLAYGRGPGLPTAVEVCPGSRRLVEVVDVGRRREAVVRRLPDLRALRSFRLPSSEGMVVECLDRAGRDVLVLANNYDEPVARGRLLRFAGARRRLLARGTAVDMAVSGHVAYLETGRWGRVIVSLDLRTGARRTVATVPPIPGELVVSPDGRALATVAYRPFGMSHAVVIRPGTRRVIRRVPLGEGAAGTLAWTSPDRLLYGGEGYSLRLFDGELRTVGRFRGHFGGSRFMAARGRTVFGVDDGRLLAARLAGRRVGRLAHLPSTDVYALAAVTGAPPLRTGARRVRPLTERAANAKAPPCAAVHLWDRRVNRVFRLSDRAG